MDYGYVKDISLDFDAAKVKITEALSKEGFGILSEIDVKATLKKKRDIDFRPYTILGACNPDLAHKALMAEEQIGLLLPCNVVVQAAEGGGSRVSILKPKTMFEFVDNASIAPVAEEADARLRRVMEAL